MAVNGASMGFSVLNSAIVLMLFVVLNNMSTLNKILLTYLLTY